MRELSIEELGRETQAQTQPAGTWETYIGGPTRQVMQMGVEPIKAIGESVMTGDYNPLPRMLEALKNPPEPGTMARILNPWDTPVNAAISIAAPGSQQLVRAGGRIPLTGAKAGLTRTAITTAAGGAAGAMSDEGVVSGATKGATAGLLSEGINAGINFVRKAGMDRVLAQVQTQDAQKAGEAIERAPGLGGVFRGRRTPDDLYDLAYGAGKTAKGQVGMSKGEALLKDAQDVAELRITSALDARARQGVNVRFPLHYQQNPTTGAKEPTVGLFGPWNQAREQLSELGALAATAKPHRTYSFGGRTYHGTELKELYARSLRAFQQQLTRVGPEALQTFISSKKQYGLGLRILDLVKEGFKGKGTAAPDRTVFDSSRIQEFLRTHQPKLRKELDEETLAQLNAIFFAGTGKTSLVDTTRPIGIGQRALSQMPFGLRALRGPNLVGDRMAIDPVQRALRGGIVGPAATRILPAMPLPMGIPGLSVPQPQLFDPANPLGPPPDLRSQAESNRLVLGAPADPRRRLARLG